MPVGVFEGVGVGESVGVLVGVGVAVGGTGVFVAAGGVVGVSVGVIPAGVVGVSVGVTPGGSVGTGVEVFTGGAAQEVPKSYTAPAPLISHPISTGNTSNCIRPQVKSAGRGPVPVLKV